MAESDRAGSKSRPGSEVTTDSKTVTPRKSRLLSIARQSFVKSGGQRGASVETLRGTHGADFENKAVVTRGGGEGVFCGCFGSSVSLEKVVVSIISGLASNWIYLIAGFRRSFSVDQRAVSLCV
jgi:hypothetical protein